MPKIDTNPQTNDAWLAHWQLVNLHSHRGCPKSHKSVEAYQSCINRQRRKPRARTQLQAVSDDDRG